MQSQQKPQVIGQPFCAQGDKRNVPEKATGSNRPSMQEGFPPITGEPINEGGEPPEREDFNGILNLNSQFSFAYQNGCLSAFDDDVSNAIGGYALNAILWDPNTKQFLQSNKADNTDNYITTPTFIGTSWIPLLAKTDLTNLSSDGQSKFDAKLNLSGGTMTGNLILNENPTQNLQAAPKQYVDSVLDSTNIDISAAVPQPWETVVKAVSDGYLYIRTDQVSNVSLVYFSENENLTPKIEVYRASGSYAFTVSSLIKVAKGMFYKGTGGSARELIFYPVKGAI